MIGIEAKCAAACAANAGIEEKNHMIFDPAPAVCFSHPVVSCLRAAAFFLRAVVSFLRAPAFSLRTVISFLRTVVFSVRAAVSFLRMALPFLRAVVSFLRAALCGKRVDAFAANIGVEEKKPAAYRLKTAIDRTNAPCERKKNMTLVPSPPALLLQAAVFFSKRDALFSGNPIFFLQAGSRTLPQPATAMKTAGSAASIGRIAAVMPHISATTGQRETAQPIGGRIAAASPGNLAFFAFPPVRSFRDSSRSKGDSSRALSPYRP